MEKNGLDKNHMKHKHPSTISAALFKMEEREITDVHGNIPDSRQREKKVFSRAFRNSRNNVQGCMTY